MHISSRSAWSAGARTAVGCVVLLVGRLGLAIGSAGRDRCSGVLKGGCGNRHFDKVQLPRTFSLQIEGLKK